MKGKHRSSPATPGEAQWTHSPSSLQGWIGIKAIQKTERLGEQEKAKALLGCWILLTTQPQ